MLQSINEYTLNSNIHDYTEESVIEIHEATYDFYESFFGIKRLFKDEEFYFAGNDIFISRKADHALIAAVNGIIYKIYYRFSDSTEKDCVNFRISVMAFLGNYIEKERINNPVVTEYELGKTLMWKYDFGNIILELIDYSTAICFTSCVVDNAIKLNTFKDTLENYNKSLI